MNKSELIEEIASKSDVTKKQAAVMLESFVSTITGVLSDGEQIVLPSFGTFSVGLRSARKGRNPKTGEVIEIKASRVAKFKAGKGLKDAVQINAEEAVEA
jgi:DNA-binding protein HU-beta